MIVKSRIKTDEISPSGHIYKKEAVLKVCEFYNSRSNRYGGILDRKEISNLGSPTHFVNKLFVNESNELVGDVEFLNNNLNNKNLILVPVIMIEDSDMVDFNVIENITNIMHVQIEETNNDNQW